MLGGFGWGWGGGGWVVGELWVALSAAAFTITWFPVTPQLTALYFSFELVLHSRCANRLPPNLCISANTLLLTVLEDSALFCTLNRNTVKIARPETF